MSDSILIIALYKFVDLPDYRELQDPLLEICVQHQIKGTFLLALEGINGTISGEPKAVQAIVDYLRLDARLADITYKTACAKEHPFSRMKVRLRDEIVTLGIPAIKPGEQTGIAIAPEAWNTLISDPGVLVIDTRNTYETELGSFQGAIDPKTASFSDFPDYVANQLSEHKNKKIAMFCTGGIRCEKASAYLLANGFPEVYQLEGGILNYLEKVPQENSLWQGECFVFDDRRMVDHNLAQVQEV